MTRQEILKKQQDKYNKLFVALSVVPNEIELRDNCDVYGSNVYLYAEEVRESDYHELCKHLIEWEVDHYNYVGEVRDKPQLRRIQVCHLLKLDDMRIQVHFNIVTPAYHKFLNFISDGKCKIKKETIIPDNKPYTSVRLSCNG